MIELSTPVCQKLFHWVLPYVSLFQTSCCHRSSWQSRSLHCWIRGLLAGKNTRVDQVGCFFEYTVLTNIDWAYSHDNSMVVDDRAISNCNGSWDRCLVGHKSLRWYLGPVVRSKSEGWHTVGKTRWKMNRQVGVQPKCHLEVCFYSISILGDSLSGGSQQSKPILGGQHNRSFHTPLILLLEFSSKAGHITLIPWPILSYNWIGTEWRRIAGY